ncbi:MAG: DUF1566 domain-containing protein [Desulfuromonadales bacterium]
MSFIDDLEKLEKSLTKPKHPLCDEELRLREAYATGVALLMARADENLNEAKREHLKELATALALSDDPAERIIATVTDAGAEIIFSIVSAIEKQDHKYLFILDLYRAANVDGKLLVEEQKMIDIFASRFNLKSIEKEFLKQFADGMEQQSREAMQKALLEAYNFWLELPMNVFRYFCKELEPISETTERDIAKVNLAVKQGVCGAQRIMEHQEQKRAEEDLKMESARRKAEEQKKEAELRALEEQKMEMERLVYTDPQTGLMWTRNGNIANEPMNWDDTLIWLKSLNYGGYCDWRMPTKNELKLFAKQGGYTPFEWFNRNGFNHFEDFFYWTSTLEDDDYDGFVWGVSFDNGEVDDINKSMSFYIWPVRG